MYLSKNDEDIADKGNIFRVSLFYVCTGNPV